MKTYTKLVLKIWSYRGILFPVFLCVILTIVQLHSYSYGRSNHYEILPVHFRMEDPNYLKNDFFVNAQEVFNVRTAFAWLMWRTRELCSTEYYVVYLAYYLMTSFLAYLGIWNIIKRTSPKLPMLFRSLLVLSISLLPVISVGGTTLINSQLLPGSFAITFAIWAFFFGMEKKWRLAFLFVGIGTIFHVLLGLLSAGILLSIYLFWGRPKIKDLFINCLIYLVGAAPGWVMLMVSFINMTQVDSELVGFVIGQFRNPHHYIPSYWPIHKLIIFFALQAFAVIFLFLRKKLKMNGLTSFFAIFFVITNIYFLLGYVFVEIIPVTLAIKMQFYRISIFNDLFIKLILLGTVLELLWFKTRPLVIKKGIMKWINVAFVVGLIMGLFIYIKSPAYNFLPNSPEPLHGSKVVYSWVKEETDPDSIFLTSAFVSDFRTQTERAQVIAFKPFVFNDETVVEWYKRIVDVCGFDDPPECRGWKCRSYCNKTYATYTWGEVNSVAKKYDADYILTTTDYNSEAKPVFDDEKNRVYKTEK